MMFVVKRVPHIHGRPFSIRPSFPPLHAVLTWQSLQRLKTHRGRLGSKIEWKSPWYEAWPVSRS